MEPLSYRPLPQLRTETPLVSVIMFCRNRVSTIRRAVDSLLGQTYSHWELIIQDGASTDGTLEVLQSYQDPRIKLVSEPDRGPFDAMWRAYRRCTGEITGSCLSDEELFPNALAEGVQYLLCFPETAAVARDVYLMRPDGTIYSRYNCHEFNFIDYASINISLTLQAVLFRREALLQIGLLDRAWRIDCADFELFTLISREFRLDSFPGVIGRYDQHHEGQLSTTPEIGYFSAMGQLRFIADYFGSDPTINRLGSFVLSAAYEAIQRLYAMKGAGEYQAKLDLFMKTLPTLPLDYSLTSAKQAIQAGKILMAWKILGLGRPTPEEQKQDTESLSYELEAIFKPEQSQEYWGELYQKNIPGAGEKLLSGALRQPGVDPMKILVNQKKWAQKLTPSGSANQLYPHLHPTRQRRVAFHAADWNSLEIQHQVLPFLKELGSGHYEILAYLPPQKNPVVLPANIQARVMTSESAESFCAQVRGDEVDLLIELSDLGPGHQFAALAGRCAPKQMSYLGHMATSGLRTVDYQLADEIICPPTLQKMHTEKIIHLPQVYTSFAIPCQLPAAHLPQPRRLDSRFTYGSLADRMLLNESVLDCWARLLKITPNSRLILSHPSMGLSDRRAEIWKLFRRYDIPRESLLIVPRLPGEISPFLTAQFDLYLDTFPYSDPYGLACSLSRGIPGITLAGVTMGGRLGTSILIKAGLQNFVTRQIEEYAVLANALANRFSEIQELKMILAQQAFNCGLTDPPRFAEQFSQTIDSILT